MSVRDNGGHTTVVGSRFTARLADESMVPDQLKTRGFVIDAVIELNGDLDDLVVNRIDIL